MVDSDDRLRRTGPHINERFGCILTGMFIQDNVNDLQEMLQDADEWPLGSQTELNLSLPIGKRYKTLKAVVLTQEGKCQIPVSLFPEIERAADLFAEHDYRKARELLDNVQSNYQHIAENNLRRNSE